MAAKGGCASGIRTECRRLRRIWEKAAGTLCLVSTLGSLVATSRCVTGACQAHFFQLTRVRHFVFPASAEAAALGHINATVLRRAGSGHAWIRCLVLVEHAACAASFEGGTLRSIHAAELLSTGARRAVVIRFGGVEKPCTGAVAKAVTPRRLLAAELGGAGANAGHLSQVRVRDTIGAAVREIPAKLSSCRGGGGSCNCGKRFLKSS